MLGALLGAAGSVASSLLGKSAAEKANKQQMEMADKNIALQKEFAQSGIQWKTEDARKAGIHPLYALGANTVSFSPVSVGSSVPDFSGIASAGQDLGRAIDATRSSSARAGAVNATVQQLQLTRMGLENELLASQIAKVRQSTQPPMPTAGDQYRIEGQAESGLMDVNPMKATTSAPGHPSAEPGAVNDLGYARTPTGWAIVPSNDVKQRIEDQFFSEISWEIRNRVAPMIYSDYYQPPPGVPLEKGRQWYFNPMMGEYQQERIPIWDGIRSIYGGS